MLYVIHGPSICTKNKLMATQTDEINFMAHPYFLRPILVVLHDRSLTQGGSPCNLFDQKCSREVQ